MLFNSVQFLVFFTIVVGVYFFLPRRGKLTLLLVASYYFYMSWKVEYALLILLSTLIDYIAGLKMGSTESRVTRRTYLILSLCANLGLLLVFKYFNFISASVQGLFGVMDVTYQPFMLNVLLPIGISFYTFQSMSYSIDVYRGDRKPEQSLLVFALYISFFPQLVAGPIERSTHLIPQFHQEKYFDWNRLTSGFAIILWGFFLKLVIADQVAPYVNTVYGAPEEFNGGHFLMATYLFAFQIFGDFAGYSSIAIGVAKILGYDLMQNFKRPYFSTDIREFWGRWHISLSTWFRDYLYIPLGGNRRGQARSVINLCIVFLVCGLWHGANWTFLIWGALHGTYLLTYRWLSRNFEPDKTATGLVRVAKIAVTFHLVLFAWIFFRANSVADAWYIVTHLVDFPVINASYMASIILPFTNDYSAAAMFLTSLFFILIMETIHLIQEEDNSRILRLWNRSGVFRATCLGVLLNMILLFGNFDSQAFIYFQF